MLRIELEHKHDVIYSDKCLEQYRGDNYLWKSASRISEQIKDYGGRD